MKYLYYFFVLFLVVFRRIGFIVFLPIALPMRAYLRNAVYNYHLQNDIFLKRLYERKPELVENGWVLTSEGHGSENGFVKFRKISKIEYYFALLFWLWLDDDSNQDTFDKGYNQTIIDGERMVGVSEQVKLELQKDNMIADNVDKMLFGNTFDLGDKRARYPLSGFWSVLLWTLRNTAYNFNYKFHEINDSSKVFKVVVFNRLFGWREGTIVNGMQTYNFECGYKLVGG